MSLLEVLSKVGNRDYEDPKYTADSWKWVTNQDKKGLMGPQSGGRPVLQREGDLESHLKAEKSYDARDQEIAENNNGINSWKRHIDNLMASQNPVFQKEARSMLNPYRNRKSIKEHQARSQAAGGEDGVTYEQYMAMSPDQRSDYRRYRGFNDPSIQYKYELLSKIKDPKERRDFAIASGLFDSSNYQDIGTGFVNPAVDALNIEGQGQGQGQGQGPVQGQEMPQGQGQNAQRQQQGPLDRVTGAITKNLIQTKTIPESAENMAKKLNEFPDQMVKGDTVFDDLQTSKEFLGELFEITDHTSTGFGRLFKDLPYSSASKWESRKKSLLNRISLDSMLKLKRDSKTGSTGFGALSERELDVLQGYLGDLEGITGPGEIRKQILKIQEQMNKVQDTVRKEQRGRLKYYDDNSEGNVADIIDLSPYRDEKYGEGYVSDRQKEINKVFREKGPGAPSIYEPGEIVTGPNGEEYRFLNKRGLSDTDKDNFERVQQ